MKYHLYGKTCSKTYYSSGLYLSKDSLMITDMQDYLDDDGYWEEYYTIKSDYFQLLLFKLTVSFEICKYEDLDIDAKKAYDTLEDVILQKLFLYIYFLAKQSEKTYYGFTLIEKICGNDIPFEKSIYSKGP